MNGQFEMLYDALYLSLLDLSSSEPWALDDLTWTTMVGNAVKESHYRIEASLKNIGYRIPGKKFIINMATADIRKEGSAYDITLDIGILAASKQIKSDKISDYIIMGELSLDGSLNSIKGALPCT